MSKSTRKVLKRSQRYSRMACLLVGTVRHVLLVLSVIAMLVVTARAADPGLPLPANSPLSELKVGSVLFFALYSSSASEPSAENTIISLTNTSTASTTYVHLFFVANNCTDIVDKYLCLAANQTSSILASEVDPGVRGYVVAVAVDSLRGCPVSHNFLLGEEYVKLATGHSSKLPAAAAAALYTGSLPSCSAGATTAVLAFDGSSSGYDQLPRALLLDNIRSRLDGNDTLFILNRIGGTLQTGVPSVSTLGTVLGYLYDDTGQAFSFSFNGSCQLLGSLTDSFPRTVPRLSQILPAGRTGSMVVWKNTEDIAIFGAFLNLNGNTGVQRRAFNGGQLLHQLTLSAAGSLTIPLNPPGC